MPWLHLPVSQLDWHQPWRWPRSLQYLLFGGCVVAGALLFSPWWFRGWQTLCEATEAQAQLLAQQQATQALLVQTEQWEQTQHTPRLVFVDAAMLTQLARQQGLQFSALGLDKPVQTPALNALQLQQVPLKLHVQGSWAAWLNWLAQWSVSAPGVMVSSVELKADPRGGISAQLVALAPQSSVHESSFDLARADTEDTGSTDPFNPHRWTQAQRTHAQQHPSYAALVEPELMRVREPLESLPLERLQYVGQITVGATHEALVKVLPSTDFKKEQAMMTVHRVRVGHHVGHNFGRVLAIAPDHLLLQEVLLEPTGEWQTRQLRWPLYEAALP